MFSAAPVHPRLTRSQCSPLALSTYPPIFIPLLRVQTCDLVFRNSLFLPCFPLLPNHALELDGSRKLPTKQHLTSKLSCFSLSPPAHTDGPYNLEVNSVQGLRTGEVFTINPGELVFFECQADSNPPNSYVWISKTRNATQIVTEGPRLEVRSYRLAQAEEYLCRAFNNVTQKQDEAQFTLVVASLGTGG